MTDSHLRDDDREKLSALLDGELDPKTAGSVEAEISLNSAVRREFEALRSTWTLLDHLPRSGASAGFAERTLESTQRPEPGRLHSWRKLAVGAGWAATILVAALFSFPALRTSSRELTQHTDDLYVIESPRDDIDFLHKLADPNDHELFGEDSAGS